jgi:hypothetical protein
VSTVENRYIRHHRAPPKDLIQMMKRLDPTNTILAEAFAPMIAQVYTADPVDQFLFELERWELENQETE